MINFILPTLLLIFSNISFENNLIGLWKSTDDNIVKFLKFSDDGSLQEIMQTQTLDYKFKKTDNFIEIELENGSLIENSFYIDADTLTIQFFENGKSTTNKYVRKKLAL
ncbi:MAG: hypothetical protein ACJZZ7_03225 [Cytophagales bacterium]|nr:hypothetical protein [Marinoscillum sp.]OUX27174.1 MAG: hypothetical protein CBE22_00335 [Flammeovirgaceae bacterium TMED262]PDH44496.1 MAG: hypothetical protein CNE34_03790 [Rhodothermaeota bacterium MED-G18]|tara:strand:- start:1135 stop:1461 length:327 start_codon:yes stop_codon:yes gene_type:complete